jgi:Dynamin family
MTTHLEEQVARYHAWRDQMVSCIETYKAWLDTNGSADIQQSLRIYDLIESLRNDHITLAFLAEFSRGKTELINAMFFSDFKQRLLPSNVGRTTMCPTEIMYDPAEEPYLRLLPIETRKRQESVQAMKRQPVEWIKIRLDVNSREAMAEAMEHLVETKSVSVDEAKTLGLWDESDPEITTVILQERDRIQVPAWRHAIISYPHPLLKSGLVVLDTPGLNALGTEPELTLSMIPNAHAVLFLLALDTGVTKSDLEVWQRYVQPAVTRRIAVLNKIDLLWDDLKSEAEVAAGIDKQRTSTAEILNLPGGHVLPISAQKALVARVRGDAALLERSGVERLEELLATEIIPAKQDILRDAVQREIGSMVDASHGSVTGQLNSAQTELEQLAAMSGKNRTVAQAMVQRLEKDRQAYMARVSTFRNTYNQVMNYGQTLLKQLDDEALDRLLYKDREFMEGAWTTAGLWKEMQRLFGEFTVISNKILNFANQIKGLVEVTYSHFHEKYQMPLLAPPALNLEKHTLSMTALAQVTKEFCHDPVNMATYKNFLINKFYDSLVGQARQIFDTTRQDAENWLKSSMLPLNRQLKEFEITLTKRVENVRAIRDNISSVEDRQRYLQTQIKALRGQADVLNEIKGSMDGRAAPHDAPVPDNGPPTIPIAGRAIAASSA